MKFYIPIIFSSWIILSLTTLHLWGTQLPVWLTNLLSLSLVIFFPLIPILKGFDLAQGSHGFAMPTTLGFVVGLVFYNFILILLIRFFERKKIFKF